METPEKRNKSEANFGFSETEEKQAGRLGPARGSQGGPGFVTPGYLLRSPGICRTMQEGRGDGYRVLALAAVM